MPSIGEAAARVRASIQTGLRETGSAGDMKLLQSLCVTFHQSASEWGNRVLPCLPGKRPGHSYKSQPTPGDRLHPGFEPASPAASALQADSLFLSHQESPNMMSIPPITVCPPSPWFPPALPLPCKWAVAPGSFFRCVRSTKLLLSLSMTHCFFF